MKKRSLWISLAVVAALSLALGLWGGGDLLTILTFPFAPIADGLRALSLTGSAGNGLAWAIYLALTLWPLVWLALRLKTRRAGVEDCLLPLLCGTLLVAFYQMINPGELRRMFDSAAGLGRPLLAVAVWSLLCCYLTLRLGRAALESQPQTLSRWLPRLTWLLMAAFVAVLFGKDVPACVLAWRQGNYFSIVTLAAAAIPAVFAVRTTKAVGDLLTALGEGRYSQRALDAANSLSSVCITALCATAVTELLYNLMQVLGASAIGDVNLSLSLPVFQLVFLLAALLLARLIAHGQRLQEDNDLFI